MVRILSTLGRWLTQALAALVIAALVLELSAAAIYIHRNGYSRPPLFGGPPLKTQPYFDAFEFDPITVYAHADTPLTEDLWAKPEISLPPRRPGEYRIFVVGGSTVAEVRKPPGDRLADHLQAGLQAQGIAARVFNFGVPSYTSYNELELVVGKLVYLKPNMIIAYDGANDAFYGSTLGADWRPNRC